MNTSDYDSKITEILSDNSVYKKVNKDPTSKVLTETKLLINKYSSKLNLDIKSLVPSCSKPPKLYGLPKIHKQDVPLRPIVSQIDSPTYKLAKFLSKILSPLRGHTKSFVKDSYQFVNDIKHLKLTDNDIMVSFDVQSLFTNLPVLDCIEIVRGKLKDNKMPIEYAELLKHCLTSGYLMWKDEFYIQVDGVAMGSPVSPVVADIFMEDFEVRALRSPTIRPLIYKCYVDDTFTILNKNKTSAFLNHLNSINNKIQFTIELEANNSLAFLDILVIRNPDNTLGHTVYRKPTHTDRYLNGKSHHHPVQLATIGKSLLQRAQHLCDADHLEAELQHVRRALTINNLPLPRQH
ncbi:unnamed protein product [Danaus chrysippus]|uniref:(African queen) hypothetical protein n=1 Tax=Danaus chrysippus TaxID=151541 RepID=A0A8J2VT29_9NEOP|nr:unnamed protein product [Danaus chrysippus]